MNQPRPSGRARRATLGAALTTVLLSTLVPAAPAASAPSASAVATAAARSHLEAFALGWSASQAVFAPRQAAQARRWRRLAVRVRKETNRQRVVRGLPALVPSPCAARFARTHSRWMARTGSIAHASLSDLRSTCRSDGSAENIAVLRSSRPSAATVVQLWMGSPAHRANILDRDLTHLGVGVAYAPRTRTWYLTQDFHAG